METMMMPDLIGSTMYNTDEIFVDDEFNCRGDIAREDYTALAESIQNMGQLQPVVLQKREDCPWADTDLPYVLLAGFRRYYACKSIDRPVSGTCTHKVLKEHEAHALNFSENLQRKDLSPSQEATVLCRFKIRYGFTIADLAAYFSRSVSWVTDRLMLSEMPQQVLEAVDKKEINGKQLKVLSKHRENSEAVMSRLKEMREAGQRAARNTGSAAEKEEQDRAAGIFPKTHLQNKRHRTVKEIEAMNALLLHQAMGGLATRALAWASGNITTGDFFEDVSTADPYWIVPDRFAVEDWL